MGTRARPRQLRSPAPVQQRHAARARRTARTEGSRGPERTRSSWPADREAILGEIEAAREYPGGFLAHAGGRQ